MNSLETYKVSWLTEFNEKKSIELKCLIYKSKLQTFDAKKKVKYIFKIPKQ